MKLFFITLCLIITTNCCSQDVFVFSDTNNVTLGSYEVYDFKKDTMIVGGENSYSGKYRLLTVVERGGKDYIIYEKGSAFLYIMLDETRRRFTFLLKNNSLYESGFIDVMK